MAVSQARLDRYRADVDAYGDAAASYVEEYIAALISGNPGMAVNELRDEAIEAIEDSLNAFGDQASALALDLFDEIAEAYGIDADTAIYDTVPREMIDGGVRFRAIGLADGRVNAFTRDVADLTRYYIHRSTFENMERNCERNDLRYARVPSGRETCGFCFMLSSRGFVYRSEQTAGSSNAYHENCDCVIVPGFEGVPWNEQVEGYGPDAMRDRWRSCLDTIGGDDALRSEWDSMDPKSKARYKGDTDGERYRRFFQARVIAEAETRDFRWLNTGKEPPITFETKQLEREVKELRPQEIETAKLLRTFGVPVDFQVDARKYINDGGMEISVGLPDFANGYEIKTLKSASTYNTINGYVKNASKKEGARFLCFDNTGGAIDDSELVRFIKRSQAFRRGRIYIISSTGEYKFVR